MPISRFTQRSLFGVFVALTTPVRMLASGLIDFGDSGLVVFVLTVNLLESSTVSWVIGWIVYGYAFYQILPSVFPAPADSALDGTWNRLRAAVATTFVCVGVINEHLLVVLGTQLADVTGSPFAPINASFNRLFFPVVFFAGLYVFVLFVLESRGKFLLADRVTLLLVEEKEDQPIYVEWVGRAVDTVIVIVMVTITLPLLAIMASFLFPVLEIAFIFGACLVWYRPGWTHSRRQAFDIEGQLLNLVSIVRFGPKGMCTLAVLLTGIMPSAVTGLLPGALSLSLVRNFVFGAELTEGEAVRLMITIVTYAAFVSYSLWYWLRMFRRSPQFLEQWTTQQSVLGSGTGTGDTDTDSTRPLPARPPGYLIQPTLMQLTLINGIGPLFDAFETSLTAPLFVLYDALLIGFLWLLWWSVRRTYHLDSKERPQRAESDNIAIPMAFAVSFGGYLLAGIELDSESLIAFAMTVFSVVHTVANGIFLFYLVDILNVIFSDEYSTSRRVLLGSIALGVGVFAVLQQNKLVVTVFLILIAVGFILYVWEEII